MEFITTGNPLFIPEVQGFLFIYFTGLFSCIILLLIVQYIMNSKVRKLLKKQKAKEPWSEYYYSQQGLKDWLAWVDSLGKKH